MNVLKQSKCSCIFLLHITLYIKFCIVSCTFRLLQKYWEKFPILSNNPTNTVAIIQREIFYQKFIGGECNKFFFKCSLYTFKISNYLLNIYFLGILRKHVFFENILFSSSPILEYMDSFRLSPSQLKYMT